MKRGTRRWVLVLDRDDGVRAEIGRLFGDEYDVSLFRNTDDAVAALRSEREYVLAVCEFDPLHRGVATLVRLLGEREQQGRLRCALTLTAAKCEEIGECGCAVLTKPITHKALLAALELRPIAVATTASPR